MTSFNSFAAASDPGGTPPSSPTPDQPADNKPVPEEPGIAPLPRQAPGKEEPDKVL